MVGYRINVKAVEKKNQGISKALLSFLEVKLGLKLVLKDGIIEIPNAEELGKKALKVWIKHVLRKEGLEDFKVSVEGDTLIVRARS